MAKPCAKVSEVCEHALLVEDFDFGHPGTDIEIGRLVIMCRVGSVGIWPSALAYR